MKNSLFKRAFAAVAAVPLALTQCLTYSSYAVANDSTQLSAGDTSDSAETKEAYTLKGNLLYIAPDQVESTWYSDFYAELIEMGSKKSTGTISTERIVDAVLSRADKLGNYSDLATDIVNLINNDIKYSISTNGDITVTGSIANPDLSFLTKDAQDNINQKFDELKEEYETSKKEVSEKFDIPEEEFETLNISKEELVAKYGVSLEELDKYAITIEDIASKLDVPVETFDGVETIDDIKVPVFDFSSVDFSGTYEFVIEGSDLANGNKVDVRAKYTANQAVNGQTVFAMGDCADFALSKIEDIRNCAYKTIADIADYDSEAADEVKAEFDKRFDGYVTKINKAKNQLGKVYTLERDAQAENMAELIQKINDYADKNKYVDKIDNKLGKEYRLPSSVTEMVNKSVVANIYDDVLNQLNNSIVSYDVQIQSSEIAAFADNELSNLTATAAEGTYTLTGDFPDEEVASSVKHLVASVEVGDIYNVDTTLATVGLRIYREPVVTTTTTTDSTTTTTTTTTTSTDSNTSTTTNSTSTSSDSSTSTTTTNSTSTSFDSSTSTTTNSTSTSSDSSTSTSTSTSTNTGIVLSGEVKSLSVAAEAEGYGFYYSYEKEFHKEQVSGLTLNVTYVDDKTEEIDIVDLFDFEASPAEKFTKNNTTFKYNVALVYAGEDIVDETGKTVLAKGDTLKDASGYNVSVIAYIGVKGDINLDNLVDAIDVTQARSYYAAISAGYMTGLTANDVQLSISNTVLVTGPDSVYDDFAAFLGDVNQGSMVIEDNWRASKSDRLVDAVDATCISAYYALISRTGNTDSEEVIWEQVLSSNK
ncbi:MAG: hypothetical protein K2O29_05950 [Ruminococcus sp.]|nr:hypothetical protein [Ruminococcus sp.]